MIGLSYNSTMSPPPFNLQYVIDCIKEPLHLRTFKRQPIYRKQDYIALIKKHYKECGLPEPPWIDEIPDAAPPNPPPEPDTEPSLSSHDWLTLVLEYDDAEERVRCRISTALHDLYRDHYSQAIPPPIETLVRAYKDLGFSDEYLMRLISNHDKLLARMKKCGDNLDKIFKPDTSTKKKKKKEKQEVVVEQEQEDDPEEDDDDEEEEEEIEEDEGEFDMERDEDDETAGADDDAEEYLSD